MTRDARRNPWGLLVALGVGREAGGELYVDDGASVVQKATLVVQVSRLSLRSCLPLGWFLWGLKG